MKQFFKKIGTALGRAIDSKWYAVAWALYGSAYLAYIGTRFEAYNENGNAWLWWVIVIIFVVIVPWWTVLNYDKGYRKGWSEGWDEHAEMALMVRDIKKAYKDRLRAEEQEQMRIALGSTTPPTE